MTGTAVTSKEEFFKVYRLDTVSVPTNKPMVRDDKNDLIFQTEQGKFKAVARTVKELIKKASQYLLVPFQLKK
jgi:preprotein translocase subunit SecA